MAVGRLRVFRRSLRHRCLGTPARSCESLRSVVLPDTTIDSAVVDKDISPASCRITAIVTHPPAGDAVKIFIGLPMTGWNGRFQGVGGGGFSGGSAGAIRTPILSGYASGSTDTGHEGGSGSFALDANGRLQWQLIRDNAYLGNAVIQILKRQGRDGDRRALDLRQPQERNAHGEQADACYCRRLRP